MRIYVVSERGVRLIKHWMKAHDEIEIVGLVGEEKKVAEAFVREFKLWRFLCGEDIPSELIMEQLKEKYRREICAST